MWALIIEALVAFLLLAFIVWWTMYAGRKPDRPAAPEQPAAGQETGPDERMK